jgi:hypothetical protein
MLHLYGVLTFTEETMKKSILERFISKYNLGGVANAVILKSDGKSLSTTFISDDKSVVGEVSTTQLQMDPGSYAVYDTPQLRSMLGVLDEDITVKVVTVNGKNTSLSFSDNSGVKTNFVLASEDNIPRAPVAKKAMPNFEVVSTLDKVFVERFIKAKNALPDVETFTVLCDGKSAQIVIGHSKMNTNRVTLPLPASTTDKIEPINFHARYLKDILVANKEADKGKIEVSSQGIARVTFEIADFSVTYYLPVIQLED